LEEEAPEGMQKEQEARTEDKFLLFVFEEKRGGNEEGGEKGGKEKKLKLKKCIPVRSCGVERRPQSERSPLFFLFLHLLALHCKN
jgi:hypothetical protein